jgi:phosphocarrier protein HPr
MDQPKVTRTVTVANRSGIHLRAALMVFNLTRSFPAKVEIVMDRQRARADDILQVTTLGAAQGQELTLEASGPGAESALDALAQLFAARFHEEDA